VLVMILAGNYVATRLQHHHAPICAVVLIVGLLASTLLKPADLLTLGPEAAELAGVLLYLFPAAVAAVLFALLFKRVPVASEALAFNIFGGVVGVSLEYLSMIFGVRALGWIAIGLYTIVLVLLLTKKGEQAQAAPIPAEQ
jgi:hypothetical protein